MNSLKFQIEGFHCEACVKLAKRKIEKISGVNEVAISGIDGEIEVLATREVSLGEIQEALVGTDYSIREN